MSVFLIERCMSEHDQNISFIPTQKQFLYREHISSHLI